MSINAQMYLCIPGRVVQLDRISDFGSEGWGFESSRGHQDERSSNWETFFVFGLVANLPRPVAQKAADCH